MGTVIIIIYSALGYWAVGKTLYANKIRIGTASNLFLQRLIKGVFLGLILIPVAVIKTLMGR